MSIMTAAEWREYFWIKKVSREETPFHHTVVEILTREKPSNVASRD